MRPSAAVATRQETWDDAVLSITQRLLGRSANNSRGRPLAAKTLRLRYEISQLEDEYDVMTVRQVFYAMTVRGIVPKTEEAYRRVQRQVLEMRRDGLLPWEFIADNTRWMRRVVTFDSHESVLREAARHYRRNLWQSQDVYVEVWLEKDALAAVVSEVTHKWGVPLMVSRGQSSDTFCYSAAETARAYSDAGYGVHVFALYDADKSGRDAAKAIERKLREYSDDADITFELLAVTAAQIEEWELPTRPAKENENEVAVELDAIPPDRLQQLVEDAIVALIDSEAWDQEKVVEQNERDLLLRMVEETQ
jgi:hypothetical protein